MTVETPIKTRGVKSEPWHEWMTESMTRLNLEMPWDYEPKWPTFPVELSDVFGKVRREYWGRKRDKVLVELNGALSDRRDIIRGEKENPFLYGFEIDTWKDADALLEEHRNLLIQGGNRSSKTEYACKRAVQWIVGEENSGKQAWFFHTTARTSIRYLQPVVWKYIPMEYKEARGKGRSGEANVSYSIKNGFTDATFVFPNGSQGFFYNYEQERNVIEGGEPDVIVCDELVPRDWIETLMLRVTRRPRMIVTFTPVRGRTPTVRLYYSGMQILDWKPSPLLPGKNVDGVPVGHMPYRARGMNGASGIIWFHSSENPYSPYSEIESVCRGKPKSFVMERAYGYAPGDSLKKFPLFGDTNIIEPEDVPLEGTNWMAIDPASSRNSYMLWVRATEDGCVYVYREWPTETWAEIGEDDEGRRGPGQVNGAGRGTLEYKRIIMGLEEWALDMEAGVMMPATEEVLRRFMDPRAGASPMDGAEKTKSRIELFDQENFDMKGQLVGPRMVFHPAAAGRDIEGGIALVNEWLAYDPDKPIDADNHPKLYVSKRCPNLIWALREYTGCSQDEACKDPIDALRYLACERVRWLGGDMLQVKEGGGF